MLVRSLARILKEHSATLEICSTTARLGVLRDKQKGQALARPRVTNQNLSVLVAGVGFEPMTSGPEPSGSCGARKNCQPGFSGS